MYILQWKNLAVDPGKTDISVAVGSLVSNAASITFTGKGAANNGKIQQENLMRVLENFADTTAPLYPTVGQLWYDSGNTTLKLCTSTVPETWQGLNGVQITEVGDPPPPAQLGALWFERTGDLSGILYVYNGMGRFPLGATNGGWEQIWPRVDAAGLREEYEEMYSYIDYIMGSAGGTTPDTGFEAVGTLFDGFTDFAALDADLAAKFALTPDSNLAFSNTPDLRAQPISNDWDYLLASCRWMADRLDLPATMTDDISSIPFVQDGHQIPVALQALPFNDVRMPSEERRNNRRYGSVTTTRLYAETMNVLTAVTSNKFSLKGIAGSSGANPDLSPDVAVYSHCARGGSWTGGTSAVVNTTFRFSDTAARNAFINGANAIEVVITHAAGGAPSSQDADFDAFLATHSRFRLTGDKLRSFGSSLPLSLSATPDAVGLFNVINTAGTTTIGSRSVTAGTGTYSIAFTGTRGSGVFGVNVSLAAPAGVTGVTTVTYNVIYDSTIYSVSETPLFEKPVAYNSATDATGTTAVMANIAVTPTAVVDFNVNALSGPTGSPFTFTWNGVGSTTLIEWDIDGDGTFDYTGTLVNHVYTEPGPKTVRVRATNAGGQAVLTRVSYITVT